MTQTCFSCEEDAQDPELIGVQVTAESGPDGWPLYRCAACGSKVAAITDSLRTNARQTIATEEADR
jgi:hypothetical protein